MTDDSSGVQTHEARVAAPPSPGSVMPSQLVGAPDDEEELEEEDDDEDAEFEAEGEEEDGDDVDEAGRESFPASDPPAR